MYLQSLEIVGFKSFAQRTVLQFNRGVTAVVGPNGCGKSNVLDSLRWVLGEQSAKALRGGEMADVIFSGTDSRPALGMAEVSLTFSDCEKELGVEWNEVRVTRRIYRDGKSEYLLNKTPCRLKDIHQLFMDTGIGRSAYSIMEQGKIAQIISSRPEDRRAIFEEAAGITKFKAQKKEALRKLEHTEANLLRVSDIVKEVRRQIGSLQRQAGKARRYQALLSDLKTFDTHWSFRNFQLLANDRAEVEAGLERTEKERLQAEDAIQEKEVFLIDLRARLEALEENISTARDGIQTLRNRLFSAESRIATNTERGQEMRGLIERSGGEIAAAEEKIREQESQIEETDRQLSGLLDTLRSGEEELQASQRQMDAARYQRVEAENGLRQLGADLGRFENELNALQSQILSARGRREAGEARLEMLRAECVSAEATTEQMAARLAEAEKLVESTATSLLTLRAAMDDIQLRHAEAQKARQAADSEFNARSRALTELESRLDVLRQLQEEGEGLGEGAQSVLKGLDNPDFFRPALHGALAAGIEAEPDLVPAIEAALGAHLQAVLFKDAAVAESAALTLSAGKLGRATLSPPGWIRPAGKERGPLPEGASAWALDCVKCAPYAETAAAALLHAVAIVPDIETAFRLKSLHPHLGFVTRDGDFLSPEGWVLSGKSGDAAQSVMLRKAQMTRLEREIEIARAAADGAQADRDRAIEELDSAQEQLRETREEIQQAEVAAATARGERDLLRRQHGQAEERRQSIARERGVIDQQLQESLQKLEGLESGIAERISQRDAKRQAQSETQARLEDLRERERETGNQHNEIRLRVASERQHRENLSRQRQPMATRLAELTDLISQRRRDIGQHEARIEALESESNELRQGIAGWKEEMEVAEAEAAKINADRSGTLQEIAALDESLRAVRKQVSDVQDQRSRLEVRGTQLDLRMESLKEHITRRYQLDIAEFKPDTYALLCALRDRKEKNPAAAAPDPVEAAESVEAPSESSDSVEESSLPEAATEPESANESAISVEAEIPWDRIEALVGELTEKLDGMGPVNIDAIQEYDELEERQTFLDQQNTDLTNAKTELLEVISRINRTTKDLFSETFEKVRVNFQEMFTELFGGGKANLILADESDPLESGIEIIAKPPGKQLQSISLLSGGEMTMTAVAPALLHLHGETQPLLCIGRNGCASGRIQHQPLHQDPRPFCRTEPVHRHHPQQAHHRARGHVVRRDHGGTRRQQARQRQIPPPRGRKSRSLVKRER